VPKNWRHKREAIKDLRLNEKAGGRKRTGKQRTFGLCHSKRTVFGREENVANTTPSADGNKKIRSVGLIRGRGRGRNKENRSPKEKKEGAGEDGEATQKVAPGERTSGIRSESGEIKYYIWGIEKEGESQ